ncbi:MAG: DUF2304 domain-containing protein [Fuerstiella sp.]|nr:DUF2304 domain-containing protein [Fuerstiella sp.]
MNLFQWLAISVLAVLAVLEVRAYIKNHQPIHLLRECVWLLAIVSVAFPSLTTYVASWLGIGRGTDLVFYGFMFVSTGIIFHLYGRNYLLRRDLVELARRDALRSAVAGESVAKTDTKRPPEFDQDSQEERQ